MSGARGPDDRDREELKREHERLQREVERLRARQERLKVENERLKKELQAALRAGQRRAAPYSRGKRAANPKRPGRKAGQGKWSRRKAPAASEVMQPVVQVPVTETCCPDFRSLREIAFSTPGVGGTGSGDDDGPERFCNSASYFFWYSCSSF